MLLDLVVVLRNLLLIFNKDSVHMLSLFTAMNNQECFGRLRTILTQCFQTGIQTGDLLRFAIKEGALYFKDGQLERADLHYLGKPNRARAFADSYSKVTGQFYTGFVCSP